MKFSRQRVAINGRTFFYWQKNGKGDTAMVLLHGMPGNHAGLIDLASRMDNKYRIIIPDLPACGESQGLAAAHTLGNYSDWLDAFLGCLFISHAIVAGHSFGARIAMVFSARHPKKVSKLILINPVVEEDGFIAHVATLYYVIAGMLPQALQKRWVASRLAKTIGDGILFKSSDTVLHKKNHRTRRARIKKNGSADYHRPV